MKMRLLILGLVLVYFLGCASNHEVEPPGPIARFGSAPTIDGVFEEGEWDDAEVVQAGEYQRFRIKHDGKNLYFALVGGGGDLWFNKDAGLHILHSSSQLGSAEYIKSDSSVQSLSKPFDYRLWGLQNRSVAEIQEELAGYLAENGWVASIAALGNIRETEFAVSFDWLGVTDGSERFVKIPGIYVFSGLLVTRDDPKAEKFIEKFKAMSPEERKAKYPTLYWPSENMPNSAVGSGRSLETLSLNSTSWGAIWIDLENRSKAKQ